MAVTVDIKGGLGNQLFQLFTLLAYSYKHDTDFYIPDYKGMLGIDKKSTRPPYFETFLIKLKPYIKRNRTDITYRDKQIFFYNELPSPKENKNIMLSGYFQNSKYFNEFSEKIINFIEIREFQNKIKEKYVIENSISLHFRLGDYKSNNYHCIQDINYYINSLKTIIENTNKQDWTIRFCCEEEDVLEVTKNINELKDTFTHLAFERIDNNLLDWEQMIYMSLCTHNVIANSTFSWWSAYFNENKHKIICMPKKWINTSFEPIKIPLGTSIIL